MGKEALWAQRGMRHQRGDGAKSRQCRRRRCGHRHHRRRPRRSRRPRHFAERRNILLTISQFLFKYNYYLVLFASILIEKKKEE